MNHRTDAATRIFDKMDRWRHLPNYQLERRADLFFSLYLPEALEAKLGYPIGENLIPEFPVRIGTIYPHIPIDRSYKIDYVALSRSQEEAIFVELKTESLSRRPEQDAYLLAAQQAGMHALLDGLLRICRATGSKRKYCSLLSLLSQMDLLEIPPSLEDILYGKNLQGIDGAIAEVTITCPVRRCRIVYLQPRGDGPDIISFTDFISVVSEYGDPFSARFAQSLKDWADIPAGRAR